jgi:uncharacterized lipoprotein YddW (UPF0748 family)
MSVSRKSILEFYCLGKGLLNVKHRITLFFSLFFLVVASSISTAQITTTVLEDFEGGGTGGATAITAANSPATGGSSSAVSNVSDDGSLRLRMTDGGFTNGIVMTISNAIPSAGSYLFTADIKVDNSGGQIPSFGMAIVEGGTTTNKISDVNAGYVMNLADFATNGAALGYQTIGAAINSTTGPYPKDLTIYFSSDPSRADDPNLPANDGDFSNTHRDEGTTAWTFPSTSQVFIDNITRIGPGNFGEDRNLWISIGDSPTNLTALEATIRSAHTNNFNAIVFLARYRADALYIPNRTSSTYTNNEPTRSGVSATNDPLQKAIDICRELDMKIFAAFSCFIVSDGNNTVPSHISSGISGNPVTFVYNGGSPIQMTVPTDTTDGVWIDPGRDEVRDYTLQVALDLVDNYDIDGIIFDRVRYSGNSFGYNPDALSDMGIVGTPTPSNSAFVTARRSAVSDFLRDAYNDITALKPWLIVGATPVAFGDDLNATYNSVLQHFPSWNSEVTNNRAIDFGALDVIMPQYYRQHNSASPFEAPAANQALMLLGQHGDTSADSNDFGLMPGALVNNVPLFFQAVNSDLTQAAVIAQHMCDVINAPTYVSNGSGLFSSTNVNSVLATIRATNTTPCGTDVLASAVPPSDYLMKQDYDATPPNDPSGVIVTGGNGEIDVSWTAPTAAADGELATKYLVFRSTTSPVLPDYDNLVNQDFDITGTSVTDNPGLGLITGVNTFYAVVAVDDYNNWSNLVEGGPDQATSADAIVESITSGGAITSAPSYSETGTFSGIISSAKSSADPRLVGTGSRFSITPGSTATFQPAIPRLGRYNVYVTLDNASSHNASALFSITHANGTTNGAVLLSGATIGDTWALVASNLEFNAGAAGTVGGITFTNQNGNNSSTMRFNMDAVLFEFVEDVPVSLSGFITE